MSDDLDYDLPVASKKPWVPHSPEQRLSIAVSGFLTNALQPPFYVTAIHDSDGGGRSDRQRSRDKKRGVKGGQLDWDVVQGPNGHARKLELKRGKNGLSELQKPTVRVLTACGAAPVVAWTLREVYEGLRDAGFRFLGNVETILQRCEASLSAADREAELLRTGAVTQVRKPSKPRKVEPRYTMKRSSYKRAHKAGILV